MNNQAELFQTNELEHALETVRFLKREIEGLSFRLKEETAKCTKLQKQLVETENRLSDMQQQRLFKGELFDEIKELIGNDNANRIVKYFAGSNIYIPKSVVTKERHRSMRTEFKAGANYMELANKFGYTENYVRRIVHRKGA
jgi:Mor family transcriptional regulator